MKNLEDMIIVIIVIFMLIILCSLFGISSNAFTGHTIKAHIQGEILGSDFDTGIEAQGPYSISENILIICFGVLALALAFFIIKVALKVKKEEIVPGKK